MILRSEKFMKAVTFLIDEIEKGYTNSNKSDRGGETKYGISKASYPDLDIPNLTHGAAEEIYFRDFWTPCQCDSFGFAVAYMVFDTAVNSGAGKAGELLQRAYNTIRPSSVPALGTDGIIGSKTIAAVNSKTDIAIFSAMTTVRLQYIYDIAYRDRSQLTNLLSWVGRLATVSRFVLKA